MRSFVFSLSLIAACGVDHESDVADADMSGSYGSLPAGSADADTDTDSDTDADTDADTDSDTDADTDSDTDADTDSCEETVWYLDEDDDGFGLTASSTWSCDRPTGYVAVGGDLNDADSDVHDITRICAETSNGAAFSVAVEDITNGDQTHWFASDGTVPNPLFISTDADWCGEYPEVTAGTDTLKISGLTTTVYGYGDFIVYSCGGDDADSVFYDGDTTCATVTFSVNGYPVNTTASDTFDYQYN